MRLRFLPALLLAVAAACPRPPGDPVAAPPTVQTATLADAWLGLDYHATLEAQGGVAPLSWRLSSAPSELSWLTLDPATGSLGGRPAATRAAASVGVEVRDALGRTGERAFTLLVRECDETNPAQLSRDCFYPVAGACNQGLALCLGGAYGACAGGGFSSSPAACGPSCGACAPTGDHCGNGECRCGLTAPCTGPGTSCCVGGCVDTNTDRANCGGCKQLCAPDHADGLCQNGTCTVASCQGLFGDCDGNPQNGCETPLDSLASCGTCGLGCAPAHAAGSCASGRCAVAACDAGWSDCDGSPLNGCETSLATSGSCGACGVACSPAHATGSCASGSCAVTSCDAGWADCDSNPQNGCETSLATTANCGSCGNACTAPNGTPNCQLQGMSYVCGQACDVAGHLDCDGSTANGCETPSNTLANCGGCNLPCAPANASGATCASGSCSYSTCNGGFGNCDGSAANGCEAPLNTVQNCGGCGVPCAPANVTSASCASGSCGYTACVGGFGNCDGSAANGCETPLNTLTSCGGCGVPCTAPTGGSASCATGSCARSCPECSNLIGSTCVADSCCGDPCCGDYCCLHPTAPICNEPPCFAAGTPVLLADGSERPIEAIVPGDRVLSFDVERGVVVQGEVVARYVHQDTLGLARVNDILTTPEHRFYVDGAWRPVAELRIGDSLLLARAGQSPTRVPVTRLELVAGPLTVYNFAVAGWQNYFAGGVLVHNLKP